MIYQLLLLILFGRISLFNASLTLILLLQPPMPSAASIASLPNHNNNQYYYSNNNGSVKVVRPIHDTLDDNINKNSNPHHRIQQQPCRGLLLHCWERAVSIASSTVVVNIPSSSSDLTHTTEEGYRCGFCPAR